jgi:hypothetical protein
MVSGGGLAEASEPPRGRFARGGNFDIEHVKHGPGSAKAVP